MGCIPVNRCVRTMRVSESCVGDRVYRFRDTGLGSHAEYVAVGVKEAVFTIPEGAFYAINFCRRSCTSSTRRACHLAWS
jgi:hypothetical protein